MDAFIVWPQLEWIPQSGWVKVLNAVIEHTKTVGMYLSRSGTMWNTKQCLFDHISKRHGCSWGFLLCLICIFMLTYMKCTYMKWWGIKKCLNKSHFQHSPPYTANTIMILSEFVIYNHLIIKFLSLLWNFLLKHVSKLGSFTCVNFELRTKMADDKDICPLHTLYKLISPLLSAYRPYL